MLRIVTFALAFFTAAVSAVAARADAGPKRPNIVFLMADNLRHDMLGCAGNKTIQTPNIDRLAARGVRFENAFCTTSICAASRASVFTGQYRRAHGYTFYRPPMTRKQLVKSYPALLKRAGYRTGFVGKFGVVAEKGAADEIFDVFRPAMAASKGQPYMRRGDDGKLKHLTRVNGDRAIAFLRSGRRGQPFCLSVSFGAPHPEDDNPKQYIFDPAYAALYRDAVIDRPPVSQPEDFNRLPDFLKQSENRRRWSRRFDTREKQQRMMKAMMRLITGIDRQVGRVVAELERLGVAENTIVIFTADNGIMIGEHGLTGIWLIYEGSIRVPLVVYDPQLAKKHRGTLRRDMALNVDLAPTMLAMAGVDVPAAMQGRSLVPLLEGKEIDWRTDFFYEHLFVHKRIPKSEGVRGSRYVYARYFQQEPKYEQLFDLQSDPHETKNLAGSPDHRATLNRLRARCDELRARVTPK